MNSAKSPLLTCILATYNAEKNLPLALASIEEQNLQDVQIIIQDGNSKDSTLHIAKQWQQRMPQLDIFSCEDVGIYDAWNKALVHAQGEWIFFMGADDVFTASSSLHDIKIQLKSLNDSENDVLYFACPVNMQGATAQSSKASTLYPARNLLRALPQGMALPHQGLFHRKNLFDIEQFNADYRIAGDYEFLARTYARGGICYGDTPYVSMRAGGESSALDNMWRCSHEQWRISRHYFPKAIPWKLALRHTRNILYASLAYCLGVEKVKKIDDFIRKLRGVPVLWS